MTFEFDTALDHINVCDSHSAGALAGLLVEFPYVFKEQTADKQNLLHKAIALSIDASDTEKVAQRAAIIRTLIQGIVAQGFGYQYLLDQQDNEGNTPLHLAMAQGDYVSARLLVDTGQLDLTRVRNADNQTAYALAFMREARPASDLVAKLLPPNITFQAVLVLTLAYDEYSLASLTKAISLNPALLNQQDGKEQQTLLHAVLASKVSTEKATLRSAIIASLISTIEKNKWYYHPLTLKDAQGNTPLHLALQEKEEEVATALVKLDPLDIESTNNAQKTYYALALEHNICTEAWERLKPAAVKAQEIALPMVLQKMQACDEAALALFQRAITTDATLLYQQDKDTKETLLHAAFKLTAGDANKVAVRDKMIHTLIDKISSLYFIYQQHPFTVKDVDGNTPLHLSIIYHDSSARIKLLTCGKNDLEAKNNNDQTPYDLAVAGDAPPAELLLQLKPQTLKDQEAADLKAKEAAQQAGPTSTSRFTFSLPQMPAMGFGLGSSKPAPMMEGLGGSDDSATAGTGTAASVTTTMPQSIQISPAPRTLSDAVEQAFLFIRHLDSQNETKNPLIENFKAAVATLERYEREKLNDITKSTEVNPLVLAVQQALDVLPNDEKSPLLFQHLKTLTEEFIYWKLLLPEEKPSADNVPEPITYLKKAQDLEQKFLAEPTLDAELIHRLQALKKILDEIHAQDEAEQSALELIRIVDAVLELIDTLQSNPDVNTKNTAAAAFSQKMIPAILALEGATDKTQWSLRQFFLDIINWYYDNKANDTVIYAPVAHPINPWKSLQLSACRKAITEQAALIKTPQQPCAQPVKNY